MIHINKRFVIRHCNQIVIRYIYALNTKMCTSLTWNVAWHLEVVFIRFNFFISFYQLMIAFHLILSASSGLICRVIALVQLMDSVQLLVSAVVCIVAINCLRVPSLKSTVNNGLCCLLNVYILFFSFVISSAI